MIKSLGFLILFIVPNFFYAQEVFELGDKYGVKYNGKVVYNACYDKVVITDYFAAGKIEANWYNLSKNKAFVDKEYTKFYYEVRQELLVVGFNRGGGIDIFNETGDFLYLECGDYSKVRSTTCYSAPYDTDLLIVFKGGKKGLYHWPQKKEILPPVYDKLKLHYSCGERSSLFLQKEGLNIVLNSYGEEEFKFQNKSIDDVYVRDDCDGYILKKGNKMGYARKLRSGKYFLIKPLYNALVFEENNADIILTKRGYKYGLFYKNKPILKCKYDKIEIINNDYILGFAYKNYKKHSFDKNGRIVETVFIENPET